MKLVRGLIASVVLLQTITTQAQTHAKSNTYILNQNVHAQAFAEHKGESYQFKFNHVGTTLQFQRTVTLQEVQKFKEKDSEGAQGQALVFSSNETEGQLVFAPNNPFFPMSYGMITSDPHSQGPGIQIFTYYHDCIFSDGAIGNYILYGEHRAKNLYDADSDNPDVYAVDPQFYSGVFKAGKVGKVGLKKGIKGLGKLKGRLKNPLKGNSSNDPRNSNALKSNAQLQPAALQSAQNAFTQQSQYKPYITRYEGIEYPGTRPFYEAKKAFREDLIAAAKQKGLDALLLETLPEGEYYSMFAEQGNLPMARVQKVRVTGKTANNAYQSLRVQMSYAGDGKFYDKEKFYSNATRVTLNGMGVVNLNGSQDFTLVLIPFAGRVLLVDFIAARQGNLLPKIVRGVITPYANDVFAMHLLQNKLDTGKEGHAFWCKENLENQYNKDKDKYNFNNILHAYFEALSSH